jgi:hypothetical protein
MSDSDFYTSDEKRPVFNSEFIEPFAGRLLNIWVSRCEIARGVRDEIKAKCKAENREPTFHEHLDSEQFFRECTNLWWGLKGLNKISIVTTGAIHFGIAVSNEQRKVAAYIKKHFGFCPILDKEKAKELGFCE